MKFALVSAALLASSISQAATPIDGWYAELFGGYAYVPNNINKTQYGLTRANSSYAAGYDAGGSIGYKSTPMRYEGELTYISGNLQHFTINNFSQKGVSGSSSAFLTMANVYYDFPNLLASIQPFLGIGIGYAWVDANLKSTAPFGATHFSASNTEFTYQGLAGLTYSFSEAYALNIGYRYVSTVQANALGKPFQAQLANIGAIYRFDGGNYK